MSFPRYPSYKDSGVEWLGEVPEHWNVCALKRIVNMQSGESITAENIGEAGEYPVYGGNGLRGYAGGFTHDGTFVLIGRQGALCGNINYASGKFWASEHAVVASPIKPVDPIWLGEMLRSMNLNQYSVAAAQPGLAVDLVGRLRIVVPPLSEQATIGRFLDRETVKIQTLVEEQQRLIELLREKRQAIVSQSVTKGLNPVVPMRAAGVEWLGEVPAHWELKRFQRCVSVAEGQVDPESPAYSALPLIAPNHIESGTGRLLAIESASDQGAESGKYFCKTGDVVYSKIRPALRKVCIAPKDCLCSADMYPLRAHSGMSNPFLFWSMLSEQFSTLAVLESQRVAMPKINRESLKEIVLSVPPANEQLGIVAFLEKETTSLDALTTEAQHAVDLLQERRTALISAAVTGQIDVSALANGQAA